MAFKLALDKPPPPTPAGRRLRRLIVLIAVVVVVVEAVNLQFATEATFALITRTIWALLRVIGFLVLLRAVRFGRASARPFGLILAVTTVFAVARLASPRAGDLLPAWPVIAGFAVLAVLCGLLVWLLYRSPEVDAHLSARPVRRHVPAWVLTARVATLTYSALLIVPFVVAVGTSVSAERRQPVPVAMVLLGFWLAMVIGIGYTAPLGTYFLLRGQTWARWLVGTTSVLVLVAGPALCLLLLGADGLIRDGVPLAVTAVLGLWALHRSRGQPTWIAPDGPAVRPHSGTARAAPGPGR
jgi:hypothetical protein